MSSQTMAEMRSACRDWAQLETGHSAPLPQAQALVISGLGAVIRGDTKRAKLVLGMAYWLLSDAIDKGPASDRSR